jgi:hypothetical protein
MLPIGLMTLARPVPWAIINAGALAATVAVSFASGARTFNGADTRTASDDLIRASNSEHRSLRETAQLSEATRAKLGNLLRLLMRKFKLIDDELSG